MPIGRQKIGTAGVEITMRSCGEGKKVGFGSLGCTWASELSVSKSCWFSLPLQSPLTAGAVFVVFPSLPGTRHWDAPDSGLVSQELFSARSLSRFSSYSALLFPLQGEFDVALGFSFVGRDHLHGPASLCSGEISSPFLVITSSTLPINPQIITLAGWKIEITSSFWKIFPV